MQDPLKQGLKHYKDVFQEGEVNYIRMQDPLKQGLKHSCFGTLSSVLKNSNARSTKTRIETIY